MKVATKNSFYAYISEIQKELEQYTSLHLPKSPANLYDPIRYTLANTGKQFRPLLTYIAYSLYKDDVKTVAPAAIALELFHNFSLIHDDIMDNAPLRRTKETVHMKWGHNIAILSGDALLVKSYELLNELKVEKKNEIITTFSKSALLVCEGQQLDMDFEAEAEISIEDYIYMVELKTAVLLAASLKIGALAANASEEEADLLYEYGKKIGIAFQLKDDILDVYADQKKFGKTQGGDIIANKKTYLLIKAYECLHHLNKDAVELRTLMNTPTSDPSKKVSMVVSIYDELGIKNLAEAEVSRYYNEAIDAINSLHISKEGREALKIFSEQVMNREF